MENVGLDITSIMLQVAGLSSDMITVQGRVGMKSVDVKTKDSDISYLPSCYHKSQQA